MTEDEDPATAADEPQPRRERRHRRATRPATGGDPQASVPVRPGRDDTDAGWSPDAPETGGDATTRAPQPRSGRQESAEDRWWREQRPPHWE
ncbi:hypothetical protein [Flexivirga lutea]